MIKYPNAIVVAPPGTGKSTICKSNPLAIDADLVPEVREMYRTLKAEFGDKWWSVPAAKARKLQLIPKAFAPVFERMQPGQMLLTAEAFAMWDAPDSFRKFVVVPTPQEYANNMSKRAKDPSQRFNWQSQNAEEQRKMLDRYHDYAVTFKATEVNSLSSIKRS